MKRRVLRNHLNKKNLRTIQASHGLKEPHHIVCDATFIRSVVDHRCDKLHPLFFEALGQCALYVLPETLVVLERQDRKPDVSMVKAQCRVLTSPPQPEGPRNELKAIAGFLKESKQFYFVATQSHDLRKMLPPTAAVLRATFEPTAVWVEENTFENDQMRETIKDNDKRKAKGKDGPAVGTSVAKPSTLAVPNAPKMSVADQAFLKKLGVEANINPFGKKRRQRSEKVAVVPQSAAVLVAGSEGPAQPSTSPAPPTHKVKPRAVKGPNPLSMKKKSVRETFSVDAEEPQKQKRRVEK